MPPRPESSGPTSFSWTWFSPNRILQRGDVNAFIGNFLGATHTREVRLGRRFQLQKQAEIDGIMRTRCCVTH